jgi:nucleotide-binding universal stress UspA family protein
VHAKTPENYALPTTEVWPAATARLDLEVENLKKELHNAFPTVKNEVLIEEGGVCAVAEAIAEAKKADLIVLGTSGRRGIGKFILGSAAEEILRRAKCAVLTVGPHSPANAPCEAKFRKILFATDFGDSSLAAAAYAVALANDCQAHLTLMHVIDGPKVGELVHPHEVAAAALEHLKTMARVEEEPWTEPRTLLRQGAPAEKILEVAAHEESDLIVIGLKKTRSVLGATHLPGSVAHHVISEANCPVLTIGG